MMKGYKAFNKDLTCRGMQYEVGKTYEMHDSPIVCERGFHFCKSLADCYRFYDMSEDTHICEVKAIGEIATDNESKYCTNKIVIVKEVKNPRAKSNTSTSSSGYCNSGNWNSGNLNSGDWNSGDWNSGDWNSGDWNSGNRNSGNWNSGNRNSGDWNSGDWNSGNRNSGVFCVSKNTTIKLFDEDSDWTFIDWRNSDACDVMSKCPCTHNEFIDVNRMTEEEKEKHPEHKTIGGYIKVIVATRELKQEWWDGLPEQNKKVVMSLPNFDSKKFEQCTGIKAESDEK